MVTSPPSDRAVLSEILQFRCNHCFQALQVPMTFAGQSAPCPFCLEVTFAPPTPTPPAQLGIPASIARIQFACPCCNSGLSVPAELAGITGPCLYCGTTISAPRPRSVTALDEALRARAAPSQASVSPLTTAQEAPRRPLHAEATAAKRPASVAPPEISAKRPSKTARHSRKLLGTLGVVVLVFGIAGATVFFAGPGKNLFSGGRNYDRSTSDQTLESALAYRDRLEKDKNHAIANAFGCVRGFLTAADWNEASSYAIGIPQAALGSKTLPVPNAQAKDLTFHAAERIPETENFIVKHWLNPGSGRPPTAIWVENTEYGPRLRWDFLEQQLSGRIRQFKDSGSAPPARFYARLHTIPNEDNPLADLPDLANTTVVAISSAFTDSETEAFYAFVPGSSSFHSKLDKLLETTQSLEGWIAASRSATPSGRNLVIINDFQFDNGIHSGQKTTEKTRVSFIYGNSGSPR